MMQNHDWLNLICVLDKEIDESLRISKHSNHTNAVRSTHLQRAISLRRVRHELEARKLELTGAK